MYAAEQEDMVVTNREARVQGYHIQLNKQVGLANLSRSNLYRDQSSGCKHGGGAMVDIFPHTLSTFTCELGGKALPFPKGVMQWSWAKLCSCQQHTFPWDLTRSPFLPFPILKCSGWIFMPSSGVVCCNSQHQTLEMTRRKIITQPLCPTKQNGMF